MSLDKLRAAIPGWLGFLALIVIGALMLVHGAADPLGVGLDRANRVGFVVFGLCAVAVAVFSWVAGGTSKITGREGAVGVRADVQRMPWWAWVVDAGMVGVAVVLFLAIR